VHLAALPDLTEGSAMQRDEARGNARIGARPAATECTGPPGLRALSFGEERDSYLYVPRAAVGARARALAVLLHGAGGHAHQGLQLLGPVADAHDLILFAPASTSYTWDVIIDGYGPDVAVIDEALAQVFAQYPVDARHVAIGGFSDGASYALSLGITNGDLFSHIIAFSPGFLAPAGPRDSPQVFISHGAADTVLPIARCSRIIAPQLRSFGYAVEYREFPGGHEIPAPIASAATRWFLGG
jgi:phospholipase/carboxylesterase